MAGELTLLLEPSPLPDTSALLEHPVSLYLVSLDSDGSRRVQRSALDTAARILSGGKANALSLPWPRLAYPHVMWLRGALAKKYAGRTANRVLAAVRMVMKQCWLLRLVSMDDYERIRAVPGAKVDNQPAGRALDAEEMERIMSACAADRSLAGIRDLAMVTVMYHTGVRREELVNLDVGDVAPEPKDGCRMIRVRKGKGGRGRNVALPLDAWPRVERWMRSLPPAQLTIESSGPPAGRPLFRRLRRYGTAYAIGGRLAAESVRWILHRRAHPSIEAKPNPHDVRRTFVTGALQAGAGIEGVAAQVGHKSIDTTRLYDRRGDSVQAQAALAVRVIPLLDAGGQLSLEF